MFHVLQAGKPLAAAGRRWIRRRSDAQGLGTNSSHIGWGIGAVVIVGGLLAALHQVWLPWMQHLFTNVTSLNTTTTTTP